MIVTPLSLPGVVSIRPRVARDVRGFFLESWSADRYRAIGITQNFVQDNVSCSHRGVLRGLHLQHPHGQAKLVSVLRGAVYDVAVDVRRGSPTFGQWCGAELTAEGAEQLFVPAGFAHGFLALADDTILHYKVSAAWHRESEVTIAWDDPEIGITWPLEGEPVMTPRDAAAPRLSQLPPGRLPSLTSLPSMSSGAVSAVG